MTFCAAAEVASQEPLLKDLYPHSDFHHSVFKQQRKGVSRRNLGAGPTWMQLAKCNLYFLPSVLYVNQCQAGAGISARGCREKSGREGEEGDG